MGGHFLQSLGGKGANQAVAAARLGNHEVFLVGAVGDDDFGQAAQNRFRQESIQLAHLSVVPSASTGVAVIIVDQAGENCISVASGANLEISAEIIERLPDQLFQEATVCLACLESPLEAVAAFLRRGHDCGAITMLNPAPVPVDGSERLRSCLPLVDMVTPNQMEARPLVEGVAADSIQSARAILELGCKRSSLLRVPRVVGLRPTRNSFDSRPCGASGRYHGRRGCLQRRACGLTGQW
ncbi:MAG: PfkB family carbohydrate kinase [Pirellulaceae bacterium]|nr:PfkB family carbohydrate kinase [Pirellulaceae bacterium]